MQPGQLKKIMASQEAGQELPEALRIPELFPDAVPFYRAFNELSGSRSSGMSIGMIPFSEVSNYLDEELIISQEERRRWRHFITLIDGKWVQRQTASSKTNKKGYGGQAKPRPRQSSGKKRR